MTYVKKAINNKSKSKHFNSKTHEHKEKNGFVVKECEFIKPDIDEVIYIIKGTFKNCIKKNFHSFEYRCVYDIKLTNMEKLKKLFYQLYSDI